MTYVLCFSGRPIHTSDYWPAIHKAALDMGLAINVLGCIFTLLPGVTIERR